MAKGNGESSQPPPSDPNTVTQSPMPDSMADENWKTIDREDDEGKIQSSSSSVLPTSIVNIGHNQGRRHSRLSEFDLNTRRNLFARKVTSLITSGNTSGVVSDRTTPMVNDSLQSDTDSHGMSLLPSDEGICGTTTTTITSTNTTSGTTGAVVTRSSLRKSTSSVSSTQSYQSSYLTLKGGGGGGSGGEYSSDLSSHRQLFHSSSTHSQPPPPYPSTIVSPGSVIPPKLTVTLTGNENTSCNTVGESIEGIESPVTGRSSKSPKKKRRNHSKSGTRTSRSRSRSRSRSPSKSPSKSPSPQSLNASVLIGLTQVRRSRNEWI